MTSPLNHNVVPAPAIENNVWTVRPGQNSVEVRKIGNPFPKVAVAGNLGLEVGTPVV